MAEQSNPVGRPTIMSPEVIKKLEDAFTMGCSDREACIYADISHQTLYTYQQNNPEFVDRKKTLKENITLHARKVVAEDISKHKDVDTAKWYLERRKKDEFSTRQEMTGADGQPIRLAISQDQLTAIAREVVESQRDQTSIGSSSTESNSILDTNVEGLQSLPTSQENRTES